MWLTRSAAIGATLASAMLVSTPSVQTLERPAGKLPSGLERFLGTVVRPTAAERKALVGGAPVTRLLDTDPSREVSVFGAVWIDAPIRRYVEAVQDIEQFERGAAFKVTKRISMPPRVEDFAELQLPKDDVADLRTCRPGDCKVKLGQRGLDAFRAGVDWTAPDPKAAADAVMRRLAFDYVNAYLEGGNGRLAVYRDNSRPTFVAEEFRSMIDQMPALTAHMPDLRRYLLDYPAATLPGATSFLYWQETQFGLRPTIRISHLVIRESQDGTVVASKMLYASHYFWTALEVRALVPDPSRGPGFWFVTVNRARSDGLSGFVGRIIRGRVRDEVRRAAAAALTSTKRRLEQGL